MQASKIQIVTACLETVSTLSNTNRNWLNKSITKTTSCEMKSQECKPEGFFVIFHGKKTVAKYYPCGNFT